MKKTAIGELPIFFDRYINLVDEDLDLLSALEKYDPKKVFSSVDKYIELGDKVYLPGKWTIKRIIQHCIDTERIMAYRALVFSRNDLNNLPGFDENLYADNSNSETRTIEDLLDEFDIVRKSTILLFKSLNKPMLLHIGTANNVKISPLSLGFVIVGHSLHHEKIITERYFTI